VFRLGDQRHDVVQEGALGLDHLRHFGRCSSLTPGISTELTFTRMPRAVSISRPFCCCSMRIAARLAAHDAFVLPEYPRVDLGADVGVDAVDGDGDVVDVVLGQLFDGLRQGEAVGGHAQLDVRRLFRQLHGKWRRSAPGWPAGRRVRQCRVPSSAGCWPPPPDFFHRLFRRQHLGYHARTRLVGAVVLAVAVVALDVAGRRHSDVHAGEVVVGVHLPNSRDECECTFRQRRGMPLFSLTFQAVFGLVCRKRHRPERTACGEGDKARRSQPIKRRRRCRATVRSAFRSAAACRTDSPGTPCSHAVPGIDAGPPFPLPRRSPQGRRFRPAPARCG
jgi:hypothetical protein